MKFKIINGRVFDPAQNLRNKKQDIYVDNGLITKPKPSEISEYKLTYDVDGMIVMAGAIDIHSHIAGGNVNNARLLSPEIHSKFLEHNLGRKKMLPGFNSRWTSEGTGYRYAEMGFTTVIEPAVLPINSFLTQLELEKIPMIDKGCLGIVGNDNFLLEALSKKKGQSFVDDYVAWTINSSKCIGLKVINAGGSEFFKNSGEAESFALDDIVPAYGVSSRQILQTLNIANENLNIPHPVHVHCNNLGIAGNIESIIDTIEGAQGRRMHLAHIQFYGYDKKGKKGFSSGAVRLAESINKNKNISVDIGQVMFKPTITISSDIWKQDKARFHANPNKWIISEIEDGGGGIVPYEYKDKNFVNALQWTIGLELFLLINDPWRVFLTTDHPNGAPFTSYPELIRLLMDLDYRNSEIEKINIDARELSDLRFLRRTYNMYEIAIMTRSAPAKILGLKDRGSLKEGCIADIAIYDPKKTIDEMFRSARHVFKNGEEIVRNGKVLKYKRTSTQSLKLKYDAKIHNEIQNWFDNFYSLRLDEFEIDENYFSENNFRYINSH
ncbi:MAG: formylmethanofuran dehydrogenase subunit A [Pseudomonadota bacterium]|nr:formylmethanofuran dehydrogenase subunit A [Pseudomonadota bacterium]